MSTSLLGEAGEEVLHRPRLVAFDEELVQLVVQRADSLRDGDILRDPRQVAAMLFGAVERLG